MEPPFVIFKRFVIEGRFVDPVSGAFTFRNEKVHNYCCRTRYDRELDGKSQETFLEKQVQVAISTAMRHPVVHFERFDDWTEHWPEDGQSFGPRKHSGFSVYVFENRQLSTEAIEPKLLPAQNGHQENTSEEQGENHNLNQLRAHLYL